MVCLLFIQDFGICCHWVCRHWQASCHRDPFLSSSHTHTHPPHSDPYRCFEPLAGPTRLSGPPSREDHWDVGARWWCVCVHETCKLSVSACACVPLHFVTALWMLLKEMFGLVSRCSSFTDCHWRCEEEDMEDFRISEPLLGWYNSILLIFGMTISQTNVPWYAHSSPW